MGTLKSVCSSISRDIRANQRTNTLLRVPIQRKFDIIQELKSNIFYADEIGMPFQYKHHIDFISITHKQEFVLGWHSTQESYG